MIEHVLVGNLDSLHIFSLSPSSCNSRRDGASSGARNHKAQRWRGFVHIRWRRMLQRRAQVEDTAFLSAIIHRQGMQPPA